MDQEQLNSELIRASKEGDINIVKQLIDEGADVNYSNIHGDTSLYDASRGGHLETTDPIDSSCQYSEIRL